MVTASKSILFLIFIIGIIGNLYKCKNKLVWCDNPRINIDKVNKPDMFVFIFLPKNYLLGASELLIELQEIYSPGFKTVYHHKKERILYTVWKPEAAFISAEKYKADAYLMADYISNLDVYFMITDVVNSGFSLHHNPGLALWYNQNIMPLILDSELKKIAVIINENLRRQAAIEEMIQNTENSRPLDTRFFSDLAAAFEWIRH